MKINDTIEQVSKDVMTVFGRHSRTNGLKIDFIWNAPNMGNPLGAQFKLHSIPYTLLDKICVYLILASLIFNLAVSASSILVTSVDAVDVWWFKDSWAMPTVFFASMTALYVLLVRYWLRRHQLNQALRYTVVLLTALEELNAMYKDEIVFKQVGGGFVAIFFNRGKE